MEMTETNNPIHSENEAESLMESRDEGAEEGGALSAEALLQEGRALSAESLSEEGRAEEAAAEEEDAAHWQTRCLAAEGALADSLAFASLWAPYAEAGEKLEDNPIYTRFLELRSKGLSVNEAFAAAGYGKLAPSPTAPPSPSKAHLFSGVPRTLISSHRISGEEMAIARELLGDSYSSDELEKLYRRVAKGS